MEEPQTFMKSIFASELAHIIKPHKLWFYDFTKKPLNFDRKKVEALVESLSGIDRLPALSHDEIMSIVYALHLTPEERCRIYASLIALSVQRFMLTYLKDERDAKRVHVTEEDCERAWNIAQEVRDVALGWLIRRREEGDNLFRGKGGVDSMPVMPSTPGGSSNPTSSAPSPTFVAALNAYDEAVALASLGQMNSEGGAGQSFLEQAEALLQRALSLLEQLPPSQRAPEDWAYWRAEARKSLAAVQRALS